MFIYCLGSVIFTHNYDQIIVSPQAKCLFTLNYQLFTIISKVFEINRLQGALNSSIIRLEI